MSEDVDIDTRGRWYDRLRTLLTGEPATRDDLLDLLREPHWRAVLDADERVMIEGVLAVGETKVRDVMVPRSQMVVLSLNAPREQILRDIVESGHSRFPVIGADREEVVGILLAKDVLRCLVDHPDGGFDLRQWLRPVAFIPESKRLDTLLKEFRHSRNHMAIVVDEYGGVAGLLTIEDVLEEIVGEIDDEFDAESAGDIHPQDNGTHSVHGLTTIEDFNRHFNVMLGDEHYDTVGGLVTWHLGHMPRRGEVVTVGGFSFRVLQADRRRIHSIEVGRVAMPGDT